MNVQDQIRTQQDKDPAQLEREIDQQRAHMETLVQALESKLSPGQIFEQVIGRAGGGRQFAENLGATVKANPVPTLLTVAGLTWLYARKDAPSHTYRSAGGVDSVSGLEAGGTSSTGGGLHLGQRVGEVREGVAGKLHSARAGLGSSVQGAQQAVRTQAQRASQGYQTMLETNPLALGAIGVAVGALVGALLPPTRKEDELMGSTSDRFKSSARNLARSGYEGMAEAGREVAGSKDAAPQDPGSEGYRQTMPAAGEVGSTATTAGLGSRAQH